MSSAGTTVISPAEISHSQLKDEPTSHSEFISVISDQLSDAQRVLARCEKLPATAGTGKLRRKVQAEIRFYNQCLKGQVKKKSLAGNNLPYLSLLTECALRVPGFQDVMKPFSFPNFNSENKSAVANEDWLDRPERIVVDVVADGGRCWIKVAARNPEALLASMLGDGGYGRRTLLHQIRDMLACARYHPHLYASPEVKVLFACSQLVPEQLIRIVETAGAKVITIARTDSGVDDSGDLITRDNSIFRALRLEEVPENAVLNLDVSSMIAYVSALTNGRANFRFQENILTEQAESERIEPVKPVLKTLFSSRKLICCQSAYDDFKQIASVMAGPTEDAATVELLKLLEVVPDEPSQKTSDLDMKGKIKKRPLVIFGTGDTHKAVTITANIGFLRAAAGQGVHFVAFVHPSRALTENKEITAVAL
ncbi:UPF0415 protein C7orf25 homolog isoform X1 [Varroa destructor]|uniref:DUF1308 domain-containing protein n=1 Tax=Varroa destructor TaxID=109461 RepID=A0A7M7K4Z2_VARDE|nr:UPF0415 protein C7orf25 homolog isoform X1 [Varroa destructor]